jgi:hypothetical protein
VVNVLHVLLTMTVLLLLIIVKVVNARIVLKVFSVLQAIVTKVLVNHVFQMNNVLIIIVLIILVQCVIQTLIVELDLFVIKGHVFNLLLHNGGFILSLVLLGCLSYFLFSFFCIEEKRDYKKNCLNIRSKMTQLLIQRTESKRWRT